LVTSNYELKFLLNFLHIWKKIIQKEPSGLDKRKKIIKITQVGRKISIQEKKSEREVCLLFWLKIYSIIGAYVIPILVPKFQLKITVKTSAKARGLLSLFFIDFFTLL